MADFLDEMRSMVGYAEEGDVLCGALDMFTPAAASWSLVTLTGAVLNDYDEPVGGTTALTNIIAHEVPITDRLRERIGGDWADVEHVLRMEDPTLSVGDIVQPLPATGLRFKVLRVQTPILDGEAVCFNVLLRRVH